MLKIVKLLIIFFCFIFLSCGLSYPQRKDIDIDDLDVEDLKDLDVEDINIPLPPAEAEHAQPEPKPGQKPEAGLPKSDLPVRQELPESHMPRSAPRSDKEYVFSTGNMVQVMVFGEPELGAEARISPEGTIKLPLLGDVKIAGLTVREAEEMIAELLAKDYLVNPQVTVYVREHNKIYILGYVRNPGPYELRSAISLTSAISLAGGCAPEANTSEIKLVRLVGQEKETQEVDLDAITSNRMPDIELRPDDTIIVEEYGRISVIGQVNHAGTFTLRKNLTLLELIGMAGGFTRIADIDGTSVIRIEDGKKKIIKVRISDITKRGDKTKDIYLKPGDTVVVPESFF